MAETKDNSWGREELLLMAATLLVLAVFLRQGVLFRTLWIDESVTFWVIKDSLAEAWQRAFAFQGQSPLYFCLLWFWKQLAGGSELALRIPSLAFLAGAFMVIASLAQRMFGFPAALVTTLTLLTSTRVELMLSARPYAFGFFFTFLSLQALINWCRLQSAGQALLFIFSSALMLYGHSLFVFFFIVHLLAYLHARGQGSTLSPLKLLLAWIAALLCFAPGILQLMALSTQKEVLEFEELPAFSEILEAYFSKSIFIAACVTFVLGKSALNGARVKLSSVSRQTWLGLLIWYVLPPLIFYVLCYFSGTSIFKSRYYVWQVGALALAYAAFVSCLQPARFKQLAVLVLAGAILVNAFGHGIYDEGWKSATAKIYAIESEKPVALMVQPGLVESKSLEWLASADTREYLGAPLSYYAPNLRFDLLPLSVETHAAAQYVASALPKGDFLLLAYQVKQSLLDLLQQQGYARKETLQDGHDVVLYRYSLVESGASGK
ncbi:MAG: glycosyltransferase family 39 protein [Oligoflexia bacterium]|nr:glycosyltransferase family 39 protein [Oligoflexia bacterium]